MNKYSDLNQYEPKMLPTQVSYSPLKWFSIKHKKGGFLAFTLHRLTGVLLFFYLILHLFVLSLLTAGPEAWDKFLSIVRSPVFVLADGLLLFGLLFHGLNGVRLSLIGMNLLLMYQKELTYLLLLFSFLFSLVTTIVIFNL